MNRKCKTCGLTAPINQFAKARELNNKVYYRYLCKNCYHRSKKPRQERLRYQYRKYKKSCICAKCGNSDYRVFEFHHPSDDKEAEVSDLMRRGVSWRKVLKEIEKCQVLCSNCHKIEHWRE